jgi:hypothetical protein
MRSVSRGRSLRPSGSQPWSPTTWSRPTKYAWMFCADAGSSRSLKVSTMPVTSCSVPSMFIATTTGPASSVRGSRAVTSTMRSMLTGAAGL